MTPHHLILAINPGSTSLKLAAYENERLLAAGAVARLDVAAIDEWLQQNDLAEARWSAVVGRGGLLPPLESGTYAVNDAMLADLAAARRGEHASNLGAPLAGAIASRTGCPAFIVDPVSVDELIPEARLSGLAGVERESLSHALNAKAVAKRYAQESGRVYQQLRLIVAHLGSGISVSAHRNGRMIDVNNPREEGPFSAERSGSLPTLALVREAIAEGWTFADAERRLFRAGGIYSYFGTRDVASVLEREQGGDRQAQLVIDAMLHQIVKEVGAMAGVLHGDVDAVLITGGMARAARLTGVLQRQLRWIAPVHVYAGEDELRALVEGALRVLTGAEVAREYLKRE